MKNNYLKTLRLRALALTAMFCALFTGPAWGETVTFTFSDLATANNWSNGTAYTSVVISPITLSAAGGGNNGKYYTSDKSWRMYNGGTVNISAAEGYNITAVSSTPSQTFTISNGSASLSCSATIKFTKIEVTYTSSSSTDPSISASDVDIVYDATSGAISYTIDNPTSETLSASTTSDWLTVGTVGESSVPFTCSANSAKTSRTATVTLTYGTVTKNVTITQAGNPNVVDNISDITAAGTYSIKGTIVAKSQRGFIVGDGTGYVYYYNTSYTQADYNIGDKVQLVGSVVAYGGVFEFNSSTTITSATESNYVAEDPTVLSGSDMDARVASTSPAQLSTYVQYEGTLSVSGSYYNITDIDGASTAQGSISYPISTDFTSLDGKTVKVTGYYVGVSSSKYYNTLIGTIEEVAGAAPIINASDINISCDATSGEITYSIANAVEGVNLTANTTSDWLTLGTISDGSVPFTCSANTESEARTATITLSYAGADDVTVTVTQNYFVADYATLPFEFDGGVSDIATTAGLTQSGLGSDYSSAPKLKFDGSGDYVILHFNERPGTLTFDVKGNSFSGGTFTVQTSADGETYTDLETYTELSSSTSNEEFTNLGADVRYIKWIYTEKSSGNVALGNITLAQYVAPQTYTLTIPTIEYATVTAAYNTDDILAEGESAEIEQGTEIILTVDAATGYTLQSLTVTGPDGQSFSPTAVSGSEGAYRFTMPAYNATISVTVEEYVAPVLATYVLATSITSGKHYVIASGTEGSVHVMGDQANNNRPAVAATIDDDGKLSVSDAYEFVIESATIGEASGYSIFDAGDNGYLYAASGSSNYLRTQDTNNENGVWAISIGEDGVASIVAQGANSRNVMQFNSSSTLFSCYGSASQGAVYLFIKEETEEPITVTISAAGYSTLYYGTKNLTVPTGMEAYTVKVTTKVERSKTYNAGDVIPAGEPVVLKAAAGTYEFTVAAEAGAKDANNMLKGNDVKTLTTGGTYYYALTLNANKDIDSAGFYWMVAGGAAFTNGAHKAYLALDSTFTELAEGNSGVKGFLALPENDADGVVSLNVNVNDNDNIFNLAGQRMSKLQKGVNIVNGRKVMVK